MRSDTLAGTAAQQLIYDSMLDILPGGMAAANLNDYSLLWVNGGLARLTAWTTPEEAFQAAGGSLRGLFCPEDRSAVRAALDRLLAGADRVKAECRLLCRCGPPIWVTLCAGLVRSPEGGVHLECFFLDLSDLRRAEADLAERCRNLAEQMRREVMTGLLNKAAFRQDVRDYLEAAGPDAEYALVVVDLDDFKCVNDRWGHTFGDRVLLAFSTALVESFGSNALCGRYGGDEFVVFLRDTPRREVDPALQTLYRNLRCRRKGDLLFHCSMGCACGRGGMDYGALFDRADTALYRAKRMGKNRYVIIPA